MAPQNQDTASGTPSDAQLTASTLAGETDAFGVLAERYHGALFGYLHRLLGRDREGAEDLLQTVFLKAFQALGSYQPDRPFSPWLYRIAHNEAANYFRSRARKPEAPLEDYIADRGAADRGAANPGASNPGASNPSESPEAVQAQAQEQATVRDAIEKLPPEQRAAVMLYYFEEHSYAEIAEIMDVRPGTVGTLLNRARGRLEKTLADVIPGKL